jgi:hypothetical protein
MHNYIFRQRCHPENRMRERELVSFLKKTEVAFGLTELLDGPSGNTVNLQLVTIRKCLAEKLALTTTPEDGVDLDLFSSDTEGSVWIRVHTGTRDLFPDTFHVDFSRCAKLPELSYFRESIDLFRPFEAFIADERNELDLDANGRQRNYPDFERPAIIRWYHYLDAQLAESIGGSTRCLSAPVFKAEAFCDGVLLQLTKQPFDATSRQHLHAQRKVMQYFGLE